MDQRERKPDAKAQESPDWMIERDKELDLMEARGETPGAAREARAPHAGRDEISTPPPPALDERGAALDASIRMKMQLHEPLDEEEKAFLAHLPASRDVPPWELRATDDER